SAEGTKAMSFPPATPPRKKASLLLDLWRRSTESVCHNRRCLACRRCISRPDRRRRWLTQPSLTLGFLAQLAKRQELVAELYPTVARKVDCPSAPPQEIDILERVAI